MYRKARIQSGHGFTANSGGVIVRPRRHQSCFGRADDETMADLGRVLVLRSCDEHTAVVACEPMQAQVEHPLTRSLPR